MESNEVQKDVNTVNLNIDLSKDLLIAELEMANYEKAVRETLRSMQGKMEEYQGVQKEALQKLCDDCGIEAEKLINEYDINLRIGKATKKEEK